jgi:hypothetical protein
VRPAPAFAGSPGPASDDLKRTPPLWAAIHEIIQAEGRP